MENIQGQSFKPKSFWQRPEGITGGLVMAGVMGLIAYLIYKLPWATIFANTLYMAGTFAVLGVLIFVLLDPKARNLMWYMYKSVMRWVTGVFVQLDPIGILKSYIEKLKGNLGDMNKQISKLRGQMHMMKELIQKNADDIQSNLKMASAAKESNKQAIMVLKSRKAGRLQESNMRLEDLYKKMEILYRVLGKMYENSAVLVEDIQDQIVVKEQERKAIHAGHSAMKSAMNIINGNADQRYMFDMALEAIAEDVSQKVGEMERFMEMSSNFMDSVDLQNGIFEEEGLALLDKWEKEGPSLILGGEKEKLILKANDNKEELNLDQPLLSPAPKAQRSNQYDSFFD